MNDYLFSVIIPIYNVEKYLAETIESVICQDIGLENIQIILVNDDSPDDSESICTEYKSRYPDNITYVRQKNAGVSAARNNGLGYARGEYVNFLDSDDKWETDVFRKVHKMFAAHEEIDVIGVRQKYFEAQNFYPSLDYKFDRDKIIDIFEHYDHIQLSVTSGFVRSSAIGNVRFDELVKYSEDAKFLFEIIFQKERLGIISSSEHLYRKRHSGNSLIQTKSTDSAWYLDTPQLCYRYVFELSRKKYGYVIPFAQYYVAYDYQWRLTEMPPDLDSDVKDRYLEITRDLLRDIDLKVIMKQRSINSEYKVALINMKLGRDITKELYYRRKHKGLYFEGFKIVRFNNPHTLNLTHFIVGKDTITVRGLVNTFLGEDCCILYAVVNGEQQIRLDLHDTNKHVRFLLGEPYLCVRGFSIEFPLRDFQKLKFKMAYKGVMGSPLNFSIGGHVPLDKQTKLYYPREGKIFYYYNEAVRAKQDTPGNRIHFILRKLKYNLKQRKFRVIATRLAFHFCKVFKRKERWLISDRTNAANDNGAHFFRYLNQQPHGVKPYFVIDGNCPDYGKIRLVGKVLRLGSLRYKLTFLLADKIISSQFDGWVTNAFGNDRKYYRDLYDFDFVFLQHGVTAQNDISKWVNMYDKDIRLFVTSSERERDWITGNRDYGFDGTQVKLTGMARFDNLKSEPKKLIAIMPTWRTYLSGRHLVTKGIREYNPGFRESDYYKFYNTLINAPELAGVMEKYGYRGVFVVHPSHKENHVDFQANGPFGIVEGIADYQSIFREADMLVSDYSSVFFDFAYLEKPVIYAQFDRERFAMGHMKPGYFDYERDGFGPVATDLRETLDKMIEAIENGCAMEQKYLERVRSFFAHRDRLNCARIYQEIMGL